MTDEPSPTSEFALINWFRQREQSRSGCEIKQGIGDDCAILGVTPGCDLLVTTDMLMDGRHFRLEQDGPEAVGYKAMGVNLSDIAAMAGVPRAVVVAVALPRRDAIAVAQGIYNGMQPLADQFQVRLGWRRYQCLGWSSGHQRDVARRDDLARAGPALWCASR